MYWREIGLILNYTFWLNGLCFIMTIKGYSISAAIDEGGLGFLDNLCKVIHLLGMGSHGSSPPRYVLPWLLSKCKQVLEGEEHMGQGVWCLECWHYFLHISLLALAWQRSS